MRCSPSTSAPGARRRRVGRVLSHLRDPRRRHPQVLGSGTANGQLGYGDATSRTAPEATAVVNLGAGRTAKAVSTGSSHTCALLDDDTLKCWGDNSNGRVGVGSSDELIWDPTEVKFDAILFLRRVGGCARPLRPERYGRRARPRWPER